MEKKNKMSDLFLKIFLIVAWLLTGSAVNDFFKQAGFVAAYMFSLFVLWFVKNNNACLIIVLVITFGVGFYSHVYLFLALPPLLLLVSSNYKIHKDKKNNKTEKTLIYLSAVVSLIFAVYTAITYSNNSNINLAEFCIKNYNQAWFVLIFAYMFYFLSKKIKYKNYKISKDQAREYLNFLKCAFWGVCVTFFYIFMSCIYNIENTNLTLFYWFVFILEMSFSNYKTERLVLGRKSSN